MDFGDYYIDGFSLQQFFMVGDDIYGPGVGNKMM